MGGEKGRGRPVRWTAEQCIQALKLFLDREGRMPCISEQGSKAGLASPVTFQRAVGCSYAEYGHRYEESTRWTAEKCMAAVDQFVQNNGRRPRLQSEANLSSGLPDPKIFLQRTGITMGTYLKNEYPELPTPKSLELPAPKKSGRVWTKNSITAATDRFMETYGRYPAAAEYGIKYGLPSHNTILAHFGVPAGVYWKRRYPMVARGWTTDSILQAFKQFIQAHGRLPLTKELRPENGLPTSGTVIRHTGAKNYPEFCRTHYPQYLRPEAWTRESCIQAMERFLEEYGRRPRQEDHKLCDYLPCPMTFLRKVGESEYQYCTQHHPELNLKWTKGKAIQALEHFVKVNGRPPLAVEFLSANHLPAYASFSKAVGMSAGAFLREHYPEYYEIQAREQNMSFGMRML